MRFDAASIMESGLRKKPDSDRIEQILRGGRLSSLQ